MMLQNFVESAATYSIIELLRFNIFPLRAFVKIAKNINSHPLNPTSYLSTMRSTNATFELIERITRHYPKPEFGINEITIKNKKVNISQEVVLSKTFCNLVHFKKIGKFNQPKLLIVAPMSGHYATLCRGTVEATLEHFDVYITDWKNARDIPLSRGNFDMDDFIDYCIEFFIKLKNKVNVLAVCQPSVPVSAAIAIMSHEKLPFIPKTMTLIGGPIDTRSSPTQVNNFAEHRPTYWFENNLITRVPVNYPGFMRAVYPGFLQLAGFMAMNMQRHLGEHVKLFQHLIIGDEDNTKTHRKFYDEYLAVMDLPAEFYIQTIDAVFKNHLLPTGKLISKGRNVNLKDIHKTALLVIEGEFDDITGIGQTKAAIDLCTNIPNEHKKYHFQEKVGHYGLFNGSKFRKSIIPVIKDFVYKHN